MKSILLTAVLLMGFAASAQSVCKVSDEIAQSIDDTKNSGMMFKPMYITIRSLIATDECVAGYLQPGDSSDLAQKIMNLKIVPSAQILNYFVNAAEEKIRKDHPPVAPEVCKASAETLMEVDQLRSSGMNAKVVYVSVKGTLVSDECIASELSQGEVYELAQRLVFEAADSESSEAIINEALAH